MSRVLTELRARYGSLQPAYRRVADYILQCAADVPFMSVQTLAHNASVSVASVSRFAKEVGFGGFRDFKSSLSKDSPAAFHGIFEAVAEEDTDVAVIEKVFSGNIRGLEETLSILDRRQLVISARKVAACRRLVLFGIGSSGYVAGDAAMRFSQLDIQAAAPTDVHQMLDHAMRLGRQDVAVGISHSGRSAVVVRAVEIAGKAGAFTIGISNYLQSPLHAQSKAFVCTSFRENRVRVAALASQIAQTCAIDAMYLLTARHKRVPMEPMERLNRCIEGTLRLPERGPDRRGRAENSSGGECGPAQ